MKLTKSKLHQLIKEESEALIDDDYDEDNPPPEEMIADVMQDGLAKLIPGFDKDIDLETRVHDRMIEFARELYELMGSPHIEVDSERYYSDPDERDDGTDWEDDDDDAYAADVAGENEPPVYDIARFGKHRQKGDL